MKHNKQLWILLVVALLAVAGSGSVFADLNAIDIRDTFNAKNNDQGFRFSHVFTPNSLRKLTTFPGYDKVDFSAYVDGLTGGENYFTTVCVQPDVNYDSGWGHLDYNPLDGKSRTSQGHVLSVGAALLYKQYATGELRVTTETEVIAFYTAIRVLMGEQIVNNWANNEFLKSLALSRGDAEDQIDYWYTPYDPAQYYDDIGDYCVFVMQVTDLSGVDKQDFLYIAPATPPDDVPEPATVLIWTLGGMGLVGSWMRQRRTKKLSLTQ